MPGKICVTSPVGMDSENAEVINHCFVCFFIVLETAKVLALWLLTRNLGRFRIQRQKTE